MDVSQCMGESGHYKKDRVMPCELRFKYANWRIYFFNNLSKLPKSALLVPKLTTGTRP